jgi:hypothetical protein
MKNIKFIVFSSVLVTGMNAYAMVTTNQAQAGADNVVKPGVAQQQDTPSAIKEGEQKAGEQNVPVVQQPAQTSTQTQSPSQSDASVAQQVPVRSNDTKQQSGQQDATDVINKEAALSVAEATAPASSPDADGPSEKELQDFLKMLQENSEKKPERSDKSPSQAAAPASQATPAA